MKKTKDLRKQPRKQSRHRAELGLHQLLSESPLARLNFDSKGIRLPVREVPLALNRRIERGHKTD